MSWVDFVESCGVRRTLNPASFCISCADECCEDRQLLLTVFKEIESENNVSLYDMAAESAIELLPELEFPPGKRGELVFDLTVDNVAVGVASLSEECARMEAAGETPVLGLDCEWEPPVTGQPPNPVATIQLSTPDGTAYCFHLQRGKKKTKASDFPLALKKILKQPSIVKVREHFVDVAWLVLFRETAGGSCFLIFCAMLPFLFLCTCRLVSASTWTRHTLCGTTGSRSQTRWTCGLMPARAGWRTLLDRWRV